jgi:hypothetical protein
VIVDCSFIGWQIQDTIALTIKYYQSFCRHVTYYDNHSTDLSRDIAAELGCTVKNFGTPGVLDDQEYIKVKNSCWKGSDADFVIVCDDDEILYHKDLVFILRQELMNKTTIFKTHGWGMYSHEMPVNSWLDIQTGQKDNKYSKSLIFSPKISDIGFVYGSHVCKPTGNLVYSKETLEVLHFMAVGGPDRMIARHAMYAQRLSEWNKRWGCGVEYTYSPESKRTWWETQYAKSKLLSEAGGPFWSGVTRNLQRKD